ncbi:hypothetical protein Y032_0041g402 [Ancylostoma ceylanicum]|uniref:Uncharacterized protein n=1 Tax=Ancylostoma ceylanicum TaxID=53326 RepID=A0A016UGC0_9BILA|nr:hypothetical protein Y032_0041g402 [Ancylostoma ceylanicum]
MRLTVSRQLFVVGCEYITTVVVVLERRVVVDLGPASGSGKVEVDHFLENTIHGSGSPDGFGRDSLQLPVNSAATLASIAAIT